ncbi:MAG: sugar phosphate isomerase/epimerase [Proteobacteria bacterium]|nr:sugar phosphate isomerase/epimerase [Pseudomonadota bacterium]
MKILFSTGCLYYLPIKEVFLLAAEAGFDGCDLVIDGRFNDAHYIKSVVACLEILPIYSVHAPFAKIDIWKTHKGALIQSVEVAKILGAQLVNFHPPSWFSLELAFLKWFRNINDFQQAFGYDDVYLTIENMPRVGKRLMLAPYVLYNYRDLIAFGMKKNLFFAFDTTHIATCGDDLIVAFLHYFKTERLKNIHISDGQSFKSHLFLGRGDLPIVKLLNTMRRLGYDGMVTLELSPGEFPKTMEWTKKLLKYQAAFLRLHLEKD